MPKDDNEDRLLTHLVAQHGVSKDAIRTVLGALKSSGGSIAQFSHPEFGGMCQWMPGMTMVGDMFNTQLKAKLDAVASDLAAYLRSNPEALKADRPDQQVSYRGSGAGASANWWPGDLGQPGATGSQNSMRYAVFPSSRRLAIKDGGEVTVYNTGDHLISGVSQTQSSDQTLTFTSQSGLVRVSDLRAVVRRPAGKG